MGVNLKGITPATEIKLDDLKHKTLVIDGYNILYQFITTIRQPDGQPLRDQKGRVTSHLIGMFSRCTRFMAAGIKLIFVFDGTPPDLKRKELERRGKAKAEAREALEKATAEGDVVAMKKYSMRVSKLTEDMVGEAKELCRLMGIPYVQAPSEGEAQVAYIVKQGDAWAGVSQDYDALLYGCPRIIHNLNLAGKRKQPGTLKYKNVHPELVVLKDVLSGLELDLDQLKALSVLVGTDYNPGGVKGIGPKKGMKLVQEEKEPQAIFDAISFNDHNDVVWEDIWKCFSEMPVEKNYELKWGKPDAQGLHKFLVEERQFSAERVKSGVSQLQPSTQKGLGDFV